MRRYIFVILLVAVLAVTMGLRWIYARPEPAGGGPARSGKGALPLVIISPHVEGIRREFAGAFDRWHEQHYGAPVEIDWRNVGGTKAIVKFFEASKGLYEQIGTYHIDLVWGGGDTLFNVDLKRGGHLAPVALEEGFLRAAFPQPVLGGVPLYDTDTPPQWFGTALSSFGICCNRDVLRQIGAPEPKTWRDLADPHLRGWIVMADPTLSSSALASYMTVVERSMADAAEQGRSEDAGWAEGMGLLRQIAANARLFTDASSSLPGQVSSGDVAASMMIDFHALAQIDAVGRGRMVYVEPANATAVTPDPIAMVRGAEHEEVARHFIEFVLSAEGQRLWYRRPGEPGGPRETALYRLPVRASVYEEDAELRSRANPFAAVATFNTSAARKKTNGILGELVQMSMLDLLDELRETRAEILASPRAAELDAKLGVFPFDQREALRRMGEWSRATAVERMRLQREWTGEFRDEYRRLREEANVAPAVPGGHPQTPLSPALSPSTGRGS